MTINTSSYFRSIVVVALGLFSSGLPNSQAQALSQSTVVDIPPEFRPFYQGYVVDPEAVRAALPYQTISLERSGGMLIPGGLFKLTLSRTGAATLWSDGSNGISGAGDFVGTVNIFDLGKISHLISQVGFHRLAPRYEARLSDLQTMTVSVVGSGGQVVVSDYGGAGPVGLWSIQQTLEAIARRIHWKPK
jgi:hypothetical protein